MLTRLILCFRSKSLRIEIEMLVSDGRLQRIVKMGGAVPDAVGLVYQHMIHLHREEDIECRLPGLGINIGCDTKRRRSAAGVFDHIDPTVTYFAEIEGE